MALSEKSRSTLYQALTRIADEEAVADMLAHFPTRDRDERVTRDHLDRRIAELRTEITDVRGDLRTEIADLRGDLHAEIAASANRTILWLGGTIIGVAGIALALSERLGG